nr:unnamed protein product [Callosobruchus chinensis]
MSGRPLTDEELEELANQISSDSEADDDIEVENVWDSDDSIADPDLAQILYSTITMLRKRLRMSL